MRWLCFGAALALLGCGDDDGVTVDAGPLPVDAGTMEEDAGSMPEDAGPLVEDDAGPLADDAGPLDGGPLCLDVTELQGMYATELEGTCEDIIDFADQMIDPTVGGGPCDVTFSSIEAKGSLGVNGDATVDLDGDFEATDLTLNTSTESCSGEWDGASLSMTLTCPDCTITLTQIDDEV